MIYKSHIDSQIFILSLILSIVSVSSAQVSGDKERGQSRLGLGADVFIYSLDEYNIEHDTLLGNVKIVQDSLFLFCDRAYVTDKSYVEAIGNVSILQSDSIEIFSDSLIYDDNSQIVNLFGEVIFKKGSKKLYTTEAIYNIQSKQAFYVKGATLYNEGTELLSEKGIYDIDANMAFFRGKVIVRDSASLLTSDSLNYDLARETIYIIAPTNIHTDSSTIYCEDGFYNYKIKEGKFYNNLQIITGDKTILADRVYYFANRDKYILSGHPVINNAHSTAQADTIVYFDKKNEVELIGHAFYKDTIRELRSYRIDYNLNNDQFETTGKSELVDVDGRVLRADKLFRKENGNDIAESNVSLQDEKESTTLFGDRLISDKDKTRYKAFNKVGQPLLIKGFGEDSLFLRSDTLYYFSVDSVDNYRGRQNVQFLKGIISGRASDLIYIPQDSVYIFSGNPIIWSDSIQITGDTLKINMAQDEIVSMEVIGNAFMIMQSGTGSFDQVKGDKITNFFTSNTLTKSHVKGNVELLYFMYENQKLEGINHSFCGELFFFFKKDELDHIKFVDKPNSKFNKADISDEESHNLQGFSWDINRQPLKQAFLK